MQINVKFAYITKLNSMRTTILIAGAAIALCSACTAKKATNANNYEDLIRVDQCGYLPQSAKQALLLTQSTKFKIIDNDGNTCFEGEASEKRYWPEAGDSIRIATFSDLITKGKYQIVVDDSIYSHPFCICNNVYKKAALAAAKAFYYNRSGMAIDSALGGQWAREAGHPDTCILVHSSAASKMRPEGFKLSSPLGWYDAGDYNKYIVNSGITTYSLLYTISTLDKFCETTSIEIPESDNQLPDLLNETLYNLRWMLTMQDPNDGGVYHKLTTLSFEGFIMPDKAIKQRYVVAKSTAADLDLAATAAYAARLLKKYDTLQSLADSCAKTAVAAYAHAVANPDLIFTNPSDVSTGEYGDKFLSDEWFWASSELYLLTNDKRYSKQMESNAKAFDIPSWGNVATLGLLSLTESGYATETFNPKDTLLSITNKLISQQNNSPIMLSLNSYDWGSNSSVANEAMIKMAAYRATSDDIYRASALNDIHYIFGRNATGYSYQTGIGSKQPMHIHHRPSAADNIDEPVPGFLVGGPNTIVPTDCGENNIRSQYPAAAYADQECSYSTNEIAINWNAPLVNVLWSICASN